MKTLIALLLLLNTGLLMGRTPTSQEDKPLPKSQEAKSWKAISQAMDEAGKPWLTVMDRPSLTTGIYRLPAGGSDGQQPHRHDEIYYIIKGKGTLSAGDEELPMQAGSIAFVAREVEHRFHDIEEDLEVLVFFSKYSHSK